MDSYLAEHGLIQEIRDDETNISFYYLKCADAVGDCQLVSQD